MNMASVNTLAVVILTHNEELHIERCLRSISQVADEVHIVDSGSTDRTVDIARSLGASVYHNPWKNYASQLNWGLENCPTQATWVMRLDCDEYLTDELAASIQRIRRGEVADTVSGFWVSRLVIFKERAIRWGGYYPTHLLRIWRRGQARCEERWMDEHMVLSSGHAEHLKGDLIDHNLNHIGWWVTKHNNYATREAIDLLNIRHRWASVDSSEAISNVAQAKWKRRIKENVYGKMSPGFRAVAYFVYRYLFRLGFLDGKQGFIFHFMQGLWYRLLVDVKQMEIERYAQQHGVSIAQAIEHLYGIKA